MRRALLLLLFLALAPFAHAQATDDFGGLMSEACPAPKHRVTATCSQTTTTQTCTIANATITADPNVSYDYDVTISSPSMSFIIGVNEPMAIGGTSTAMDWVYKAPATDWKNGASIVASVTTGSPGSITLTAFASATVSSTSGWLEPLRYYTPFSQGTQIGVTPAAAQFTVNDANGKPTYPICTPEGHRVFVQAVSLACSDGNSGGGQCAGSASITSISASGGVVTATVSNANLFGASQEITVSGVTGTGYNGTFQIQTVTARTPNTPTMTFTYNDASATGAASGGTVTVAGWGPSGTNKYSTTTVAASQESAKYQTLGFNAIGEDSDGCITIGVSCLTASVLPALNPYANTVLSPTQYSSVNLSNYLSEPVVNFVDTVPTATYAQGGVFNGPGAAELDWLNPNFAVFFRSYSTSGGTVNANIETPSVIGDMADDSDVQQITDGSGLWRGTLNNITGNGGGQRWHVGAELAVASPHMATDNHSVYGSNAPLLFPSDKVYSKTLSASAPAGCWSAAASTTPGGSSIGPTFAACSWPDWVRNWYNTTTAMNTAWGSNYTTFGSSETVVTSAAAGTGNGSTTTFNTTLTGHTSTPDITPTTVQVSLTPSGGTKTLVAGDCPVIQTGCPSGSAGTGQIIANTSVDRTFAANAFYQTGYVLVDSNNDYEVVTSARGQTGGSTPSWPAAASCANTTTVSGTVTFTCIGPALTSASTITYGTGALALTFDHAVPTSEAITVSYTWGGWESGIGTGLEDESGNSWVGTNPVCLISPPNWQATHAYTAFQQVPVTDPGTGAWMEPIVTGTSGSSDPNVSTTVGTQITDGTTKWASLGGPVCAASGGVIAATINANQNWALDVTNWAGQLQYAYSQALQQVSHQLFPDLINFGINFGLGLYDIPQYAPMLQAESAQVDAAFSGFPQPTSYDPVATQKYLYLTTYFNKPIVLEGFFEAHPPAFDMDCDSSQPTTAQDLICAATLSARSNLLYTQISTDLTSTNPSGVIQAAGQTWFSNVSVTDQSVGFETLAGNLLDGHEDVTASVACTAPLGSFTCGGEPAGANWLGTDAIHCTQCLAPALALWLTATTANGTMSGTGTLSGTGTAQ